MDRRIASIVQHWQGGAKVYVFCVRDCVSAVAAALRAALPDALSHTVRDDGMRLFNAEVYDVGDAVCCTDAVIVNGQLSHGTRLSLDKAAQGTPFDRAQYDTMHNLDTTVVFGRSGAGKTHTLCLRAQYALYCGVDVGDLWCTPEISRALAAYYADLCTLTGGIQYDALAVRVASMPCGDFDALCERVSPYRVIPHSDPIARDVCERMLSEHITQYITAHERPPYYRDLHRDASRRMSDARRLYGWPQPRADESAADALCRTLLPPLYVELARRGVTTPQLCPLALRISFDVDVSAYNLPRVILLDDVSPNDALLGLLRHGTRVAYAYDDTVEPLPAAYDALPRVRLSHNHRASALDGALYPRYAKWFPHIGDANGDATADVSRERFYVTRKTSPELIVRAIARLREQTLDGGRVVIVVHTRRQIRDVAQLCAQHGLDAQYGGDLYGSGRRALRDLALLANALAHPDSAPHQYALYAACLTHVNLPRADVMALRGVRGGASARFDAACDVAGWGDARAYAPYDALRRIVAANAPWHIYARTYTFDDKHNARAHYRHAVMQTLERLSNAAFTDVQTVGASFEALAHSVGDLYRAHTPYTLAVQSALVIELAGDPAQSRAIYDCAVLPYGWGGDRAAVYRTLSRVCDRIIVLGANGAAG